MKTYLYSNGTPFEAWDIVEKTIDKQILRKNKKKPSLLVMDGGSSSGKTTTGVHILNIINAKHQLPKVKLTQKDNLQIAMGGEDFVKKLRICYEKQLPAILYDEAGDFNRKGSLTKFNKLLDRVFDTFRAYQIIVILALPDFGVLSKDLFRKKIPRGLFHHTNRHDTFSRAKVYSLRKMYYILKNQKDSTIPEQAYQKEKPNFVTRIRDLPQEESKALDILSTYGKKDFLESAEMKLQGLLNYDELSTKIGKSKIWVKIHINKLGIKPHMINKKRKYYQQTVIDRLRTI